MIVLDTNVLSEALKPLPSHIVLGWLAAQQPLSVFTTTITEAEVLYGVETLPPGRRRVRLLAAVEKMFAEEFAGRILPFDEDAARPAASRAAPIPANARSHGAAVATRNTADFQGCGIEVINPWIE